MSWTFDQRTGEFRRDGVLIGKGYAGKGAGKNNPAMQEVHNVGPLPRGRYFGDLLLRKHPHLGEYVIRLEPAKSNEMFGRADFFLHGESRVHPGEASQGCPVADLDIRKAFWESGDHLLEVTASDPVAPHS